MYNQIQLAGVQKNIAKKYYMTDDPQQHKLSQLMLAIQTSDQKAFSEFYDLTVNRVYGLVFKILGNKLDCEEVVCDVFTQIWQQASKYHPDRGSVLGWCMIIARCRALDLYRKRRNKNEILNEASEYVDEHCDMSNEPSKNIQILQDSDLGDLVLTQLSSTQRQLLALAFFRGMSHNEISQAIDMPLGSVKSNIRRALETLQRSVKGSDYE